MTLIITLLSFIIGFTLYQAGTQYDLTLFGFTYLTHWREFGGEKQLEICSEPSFLALRLIIFIIIQSCIYVTCNDKNQGFSITLAISATSIELSSLDYIVSAFIAYNRLTPPVLALAMNNPEFYNLLNNLFICSNYCGVRVIVVIRVIAFISLALSYLALFTIVHLHPKFCDLE